MARTTKGFLVRRGKMYYACWYTNGKRYRVATKETDKTRAKTRLAELIQPFGAKTEVRRLESIKAHIESAKTDLSVLEEQRNPPLSLADTWTAYEQSQQRPDTGPSTMKIYAYYWRAFQRWLEESHPHILNLQDVNAPIVSEYAASLKAQDAKGRSITGRTFNAHRAFLMMLFRVLAERARLSSNPWQSITRMKSKPQSRRALTTDELRLICSSAEGELRTLLAVGLYLGARLGDACCLEWGSVDMRRRVIAYTQRKTDKNIVAPMHPVLHEILDATPTQKRKGFVVPALAQLYLERGPYAVTALVQKHFIKCGVITTREGTGVRRVVSAGFHSLRHAAVSLLREAGAPLSVTMAIVGHSSIAMHDTYTHAGEAALKQAVLALPSVMGRSPPKALPPPQQVEAAPLRALVEKLTPKNAVRLKAELLALLPLSAS